MRDAPEYVNPGSIKHWAKPSHKLNAEDIEKAADYFLWLQEKATDLEQEAVKLSLALKDAERRATKEDRRRRLERATVRFFAADIPGHQHVEEGPHVTDDFIANAMFQAKRLIDTCDEVHG